MELGIRPARAQDARARRDVERTRRALVVALALGVGLAGAPRAEVRGETGLLDASARAELLGLGPAPLDAEGRFSNLGGAVAHGDFSVRFGFFARRVMASLRERPGAAPTVANDGRFLRENARASVPTVTWIGHATLLVQLGHQSFLTDPIWSENASPVSFAGPPRLAPPGLVFEDLPPIDFVLLSHNHYDHLDLDTLERISAAHPNARFYVPIGNGALLRGRGIERVVELDWGETRRQDGVEIACLPARHWSRRGLRDQRRALWASWAVIGADRRFYFGGDTGYAPFFRRIGRAIGPFDLAALPIGAYLPTEMMRDVHLNPEEAVRAALDLEARRVVGIHFGTFDLTEEPLDEPPRRFRAASARAGLDEERSLVLAVGETREF
jgi:N-acyl-phosphatidylethanolamine-hydrolysing phospholipase D